MTNGERAKIFAPYAALKGFGEYLRAQERETVDRKILGEDAADELNRQLQQMQIGDIIDVTYYLNHQYVEAIGTLKKINIDGRYLLVNSIKVPLDDILSVRQ